MNIKLLYTFINTSVWNSFTRTDGRTDGQLLAPEISLEWWKPTAGKKKKNCYWHSSEAIQFTRLEQMTTWQPICRTSMLVPRYRSRITFGRCLFLISVGAPARLGFFVAFLRPPRSKFRQLSSKYFHIIQQTSYQRRYVGCNCIGFTKFQVFQGSQIGLFETGNHWLERILHIKNCVSEELGNLRELTSEIGAFF
jgi:hypothetical protein